MLSRLLRLFDFSVGRKKDNITITFILSIGFMANFTDLGKIHSIGEINQSLLAKRSNF